MHVTLVEDCQDHVHHEDSQGHQDREIANRVAKRLGFTLQLGAHSWWNNLARRVTDEVGRITERYSGLEIKEERHTRELVQVIHDLRTQRCLRCDQFAERNETLSIISLNIEQRKVFRFLPSGIFHFQNYLILVVRFLDQ